MAEVHIVDIDGEQWNIKDQPLTTRVENLEAKTNITTEHLWSTNYGFIDKVKINNEYFLQVHLQGFEYQGSAVTRILTLQKLIGNTEVLRCQFLGDLYPQIDRVSIDVDFNPDGAVLAIVLNQGVYDGGNFTVRVYGDALIKIV